MLFSTCAAMFTLFTINACAHETPASGQWAPTVQQVKDAEVHLVMPEGSKPLSTYARYYYGQTMQGRRLLIGEFVLGDEQPGIRVVKPDKAPKILDGGCSVVNLKYDIRQEKVVAIFCNGVG